jgi:hypothetical protein
MARRSTAGVRQRKSKRLARPASGEDGPEQVFVATLSKDFEKFGAGAIAKVRTEDPVTYMKICASVLPKAVAEAIDPLEGMTDEQLVERARSLASELGIGPGANAPDPAKQERAE